MEAGTWPRQMLSQGREAAGKMLGLVGFGNIGRLTARKAAALGMRVIGHDPAADGRRGVARRGRRAARPRRSCSRESDVVSLHIPLTPRDARPARRRGASALMKRDAILINTARGGIVDEAALAAMLREGRLGGAALDVFDARAARRPARRSPARRGCSSRRTSRASPLSPTSA